MNLVTTKSILDSDNIEEDMRGTLMLAFDHNPKLNLVERRLLDRQMEELGETTRYCK